MPLHYSQMPLKQRRAHLEHVIDTEAAKVIQRAVRKHQKTRKAKKGGGRRRRGTRRA
jgi:hypothetical protein